MVQKLNDAGLQPNHIIQMTRHMNGNSLNNYSSVNQTQQRHFENHQPMYSEFFSALLCSYTTSFGFELISSATNLKVM